MTHAHPMSEHHAPGHSPHPLRKLAFHATLHCMAGCAIGEIAGMVIGTAIGLGTWQTLALAVALAFVTGFGLTMIPLLRSGMGLGAAFKIALAADFISVTIMEIVDNLVMLAIPGAMAAGPLDAFFWSSMAISLAVAFAAALPVNLWLIGRGKGHAVMQAHHAHH